MPLTYVTITGTFDDGSGTALAGTVTFTPSQAVYASGIPLVTPAAPVSAKITAGSLVNASGGPLTLLATDNAGLATESSTGFWYWSVSFGIAGMQPFSFFLPSSPSTVDLLALADTGTTGSAGFTNPMTTLGDIIYENASPAAARLAGNTASSKKFLTQTGTGSVSAAPAWGAIATGDLPSGVGDQPWQFRPETYGAKGDGIVCTVNTTASNTTVQATSAVFTSTGVDGGKYIMIHGAAGSSAGPLITTISSVTDTTHAVLAAAPSATVSACPAVFGTDDTTAINSAVTAASNYALGVSGGPGAGYGNYFGEVLLKDAVYILGTGPTQTGNGSTTPTFNAQIPLPYPNANGASRKLVIQLTGAGDAGYCQYWESLVPNLAGTCLVTMLTTGTSADPTFGQQCVIGGPSGGAGFTGAYANTKAVIKGISVWCSIYTNLYAFDLGRVSQMRVTQSSAHIFAPTGVNGGVQPYINQIGNGTFLGSVGTGFRSPVTANNADVTMDACTVEGYECGWRVFDHFYAPRLTAVYCDVVMFFNSSQGLTGTSHQITVGQFCAENYNGGFLGGGNCQMNINWDAECASVNYDLQDNPGNMRGVFRYRDLTPRAPTITGAAGIKVINDNNGPGHWSSPPSVPASTTAQQNTAWRDAWVVIHTGAGVTVSVINVDGTATGLTMAASSSQAVRVPSGKNITLTYAGGTPTWDWWLD